MATFRTNRGVWLSNNPERNTIRISGDRFYLDYLKKGVRGGGKGAHSSVFVALDEVQRERRFVIKFCKYPVQLQDGNFVAVDPQRQPIINRFFHEISALKRVASSDWASKVIKIISSGVTSFPTLGKETVRENILWVATELAETDLSDFLKSTEVALDQRVQICFDLLHSLNRLHSIGIIHRDIKPDNIVFVDGAWKFIDLGISDSDDRDFDLDTSFEKIGPFGYMSPEALNKCMGVRNHADFAASCEIDEYSDVFQLGMMFWFVLRGEVPAGIIDKDDLSDLDLSDSFFDEGLSKMLRMRKERRVKCDELMNSLAGFFSRYGLSN